MSEDTPVHPDDRKHQASLARRRMRRNLRTKAARGHDNPAFVRLMRSALGDRTDKILGWTQPTP